MRTFPTNARDFSASRSVDRPTFSAVQSSVSGGSFWPTFQRCASIIPATWTATCSLRVTRSTAFKSGISVLTLSLHVRYISHNLNIRLSDLFAKGKAMLRLTALFAICLSCVAQEESGRIVGAVTDPNQASVPQATVTVTSLATKQVRTVSTGEQGNYTVTPLNPGLYS